MPTTVEMLMLENKQRVLDRKFAARQRQGKKKKGIHIVNDLKRRLEMAALREDKVAGANKRRRFP